MYPRLAQGDPFPHPEGWRVIVDATFGGGVLAGAVLTPAVLVLMPRAVPRAIDSLGLIADAMLRGMP